MWRSVSLRLLFRQTQRIGINDACIDIEQAAVPTLRVRAI
jgi:hypothetical protein